MIERGIAFHFILWNLNALKCFRSQLDVKEMYCCSDTPSVENYWITQSTRNWSLMHFLFLHVFTVIVNVGHWSCSLFPCAWKFPTKQSVYHPLFSVCVFDYRFSGDFSPDWLAVLHPALTFSLLWCNTLLLCSPFYLHCCVFPVSLLSAASLAYVLVRVPIGVSVMWDSSVAN